MKKTVIFFALLFVNLNLFCTERSELVMKALAAAYPRLVSEAFPMNNDWVVKLRDELYFFSDGKLLPQRLLTAADNYSPQPFYNYSEDMPVWKQPSKEEAEHLKDAASKRQNAANRSIFFYDSLWNIHNRDEAWKQVKTVKFLGKSILVHHGVMEELAMIEQKINSLASRDSEVADWLKQINTIAAWNWRNIADAKTRSNHSYGIAIDILPKNQKTLDTYWLWTAQKKSEWWNVPYSSRYSPPTQVIKAFEEYGFIWGGKWLFYDTMHFEYRPEILLLNNIKITGEY